MSLVLSISALLILLIHLINGAQFLNVTSLSLSSVCLAANNFASILPDGGLALLVIVILPVCLHLHNHIN